jgi:SAM-dependent methyltransferase
MEFDHEFWNEYYLNNDPYTTPDPILLAEVETLTPGRAIDLGAGDGASSIALAELGWAVKAVDFAISGLSHLEGIAQAKNLNIETEVADLLAYQPNPEYDFVYLGYMHLKPSERPLMIANAAKAVKPGGTFLYNGFTYDGTEEFDDQEPEFRALFAPLTEVLECVLRTKLKITYAEQRLRDSVFEFDEPGTMYMSIVVRAIG